MDALILAAGFGTRLRPFTDHTPKALVEVAGRPMIHYAISRLAEAGVRRIVVNIHHLGSQIEAFLASGRYPGIEFWVSDETDFLCDTGGGIRKAMLGEGVRPVGPVFIKEPLFQRPFFVYNTDVWCNTDLQALYAEHTGSGAVATLSVKHRPTSRPFLTGPDGAVCGWRHHGTGEEKIIKTSDGRLVPDELINAPHPAALSEGLEEVAFSCIQVVSPALLPLFTETGAFSITGTYLRLCGRHRIQTFTDDNCTWADMGNTTTMPQAERMILAADQLRRPV